MSDRTDRADKLIAEIAAGYPESDLASILADTTPMIDTRTREPKAKPKPKPKPKPKSIPRSELKPEPKPEPETEKQYRPLRLHDIVYIRIPGSGWEGPII